MPRGPALALVLSASLLGLAAASCGGPDEHGSRGVCSPAVMGFVTDLSKIDRGLETGLTISGYRGLLSRAVLAERRIVGGSISAECARHVRELATTALANYLAAYASWNTCVDLYTSTEVENELEFGAKIPACAQARGYGRESRQRDWAKARETVRSALDRLRIRRPIETSQGVGRRSRPLG
jgi:hypothetical protein